MFIIRLGLTSQGLRSLRVLQLVVALVVMAGLGLNGYRLSKTASALREAHRELKQQTTAISELTRLTSRNGHMAGESYSVEPPLEYGEFISTFIGEVTNLANSTGCGLKSMKPKLSQTSLEDKTKAVRFRPVEVEIDMSTNYASIGRFIVGLSRLPKVVRVKRVDLSRKAVDYTARKAELGAKLTLELCLIEPSEKDI